MVVWCIVVSVCCIGEEYQCVQVCGIVVCDQCVVYLCGVRDGVFEVVLMGFVLYWWQWFCFVISVFDELVYVWWEQVGGSDVVDF